MRVASTPVQGWEQAWFTSVSFPLAQLKELCETIVERLKTHEVLRLQFDHCTCLLKHVVGTGRHPVLSLCVCIDSA